MDSLSVTVRPFRAADQIGVRQLILAGLAEHFGHIDPTLNPDLDDIQAHYTGSGHLFVVAELDGKLLGTGGLLVLGESDGRIVRVSVDSEFRGRGIGRIVVEHLIDLARKRRLRRVSAETNLDWLAAIALYRRCGFVEYGRDDVSVYLRRGLGDWRLSSIG